MLTLRAQAAMRKVLAPGVSFAITSGHPARGMANLIEPPALQHAARRLQRRTFVKLDMTIIGEPVLAGVSQDARSSLSSGMDA